MGRLGVLWGGRSLGAIWADLKEVWEQGWQALGGRALQTAETARAEALIECSMFKDHQGGHCAHQQSEPEGQGTRKRNGKQITLRELQANLRIWAFILSERELGWHRRILSRGMTWSDWHFKKIFLASWLRMTRVEAREQPGSYYNNLGERRWWLTPGWGQGEW